MYYQIEDRKVVEHVGEPRFGSYRTVEEAQAALDRMDATATLEVDAQYLRAMRIVAPKIDTRKYLCGVAIDTNRTRWKK